jgi:tetratricopeptide (TPR) repeat protein
MMLAVTIPTLLAMSLLAADVKVVDIHKARDKQDTASLDRIAQQLASIADSHPSDADAQYRAAYAASTRAEVAAELRDKNQQRAASEAGLKLVERAVTLKPDSAEYHRVKGTLCGQEAAALGGLGALKYGKCALDEVGKAIQIDPKSSVNYLSHGVGNYYLPAALGGGVELAIQDFQKAIELDPKSGEAYLWLGVALRKANKNAEAHKAFEKAVALNPNRVWAKQQLEKTPRE